MQALVDVFADQSQGVPTGLTAEGQVAAYDFRWDSVNRYPLGDAESRERRALAVLEGDETKNQGMGSSTAFLDVELAFRVYLEPRQEPAQCLNNVLLNIQRRFRIDSSLGGLAIDVRERFNTHEVDSFEDRQVTGSVFLTVQYKHAENDPRLQRGLP